MSANRPASATAPISRRTALRAGVAASAAATVATAGSKAVMAQGGTEHLEVVFLPANPVTITLAGGGPPQRGDYFYVDGPIYAVDDVNGTQLGMYHCFGAWTTAADDIAAPYQRLTTVQFLMDEGAIMGLINELGTEQASAVGAVQGGTGRFTGALGTFQQLPTEDPAEGATPAPGTPGAGQNVVRAVFDLILPQGS